MAIKVRKRNKSKVVEDTAAKREVAAEEEVVKEEEVVGSLAVEEKSPVLKSRVKAVDILYPLSNEEEPNSVGGYLKFLESTVSGGGEMDPLLVNLEQDSPEELIQIVVEGLEARVNSGTQQESVLDIEIGKEEKPDVEVKLL